MACFERLNRKVQKFQKSIDANASICFSTELFPVQIHSQQDYIEAYFRESDQGVSRNNNRFSIADNMGEETI